MKTVYPLLLLVVLRTGALEEGREDVREVHGERIEIVDEKTLLLLQNSRTEAVKQATNASLISTSEAPIRRSPCQCGGGVCGCCSRFFYETWKQKACVNVTYDPDEFSFTAKVLMNNRVLYTRSISGKNPRPICVPVARIPYARACVRFYNIYFQGRNIHLCINMEGRFRDTTLFKVGLDCLRFGTNGLALVKPEDGGGLGQVEFLPPDVDDDENDEDDDDYDEYDDDDDDDDDDLLGF